MRGKLLPDKVKSPRRKKRDLEGAPVQNPVAVSPELKREVLCHTCQDRVSPPPLEEEKGRRSPAP